MKRQLVFASCLLAGLAVLMPAGWRQEKTRSPTRKELVKPWPSVIGKAAAQTRGKTPHGARDSYLIWLNEDVTTSSPTKSEPPLTPVTDESASSSSSNSGCGATRRRTPRERDQGRALPSYSISQRTVRFGHPWLGRRIAAVYTHLRTPDEKSPPQWRELQRPNEGAVHNVHLPVREVRNRD
jgi:hypothetical protein